MMRRRRGGLVRGVARTAVVVGTASAVAGGVQHHQQQKYAAQDAQAQDQAQMQADAAAYQQEQTAAAQAQQAAAATAAAAAPPGTPDLTAQLMQLGQLKDQGVLSEEEFQAAKAKLLQLPRRIDREAAPSALPDQRGVWGRPTRRVRAVRCFNVAAPRNTGSSRIRPKAGADHGRLREARRPADPGRAARRRDDLRGEGPRHQVLHRSPLCAHPTARRTF